MNKETALSKLFSMKQMGVKLGLNNVINLLEYLGNPQQDLKVIHIAGSNGKGSTASYVSSILMEAGYKTGLYTSPHFVEFNERIRINGEMIPDEYIVRFVQKLDKYIDENQPTFFEITTALAFMYFKDNQIDIAVLETGLGGRLDATNVVLPLASVITSISLEHTRILGDTLEKIAEEKAGIIKPGSKVFIGKMPLPAISRIKSIAKSYENNEIYSYDDCVIQISNSIKINDINIYETNLKGIHQFYNCGLAILTILNTFKEVSSNTILIGIRNVIKNSGLQGRFEVYNENPLVIFDSAHNPEGLQALLLEVNKLKNKYNCPVELIYGGMADKNLDEILKLFDKTFDNILFTSIDFSRAASIDELMKIAHANKITPTAIRLENPAEYIREFIKKADKRILLVTGSIYILGDIKSELLKKT